MSDPLYMWTVYDSPNDYGPGIYVARKWAIDKGGSRPTSEVIVTTVLEELRAQMVYRGLTPMNRHPDDDAKIVETWI